MKLYYIEGLDIESLVATVKTKFNPPAISYNEDNPIDRMYKEYAEQKKKKTPQKKQNLNIFNKLTYLIHFFCKETIESKCSFFYVKATILQRIIGNDYSTLIDILERADIIYVIKSYEVGVESKAYKISTTYINNIKTEDNNNIKLITYETKEKLLRQEQEQIKIKKIKKKITPPLYNNYNQSLNKIKMRITEAEQYVSQRDFIKENQKNYYLKIIEKFKSKEKFHINSIDKNNRIYSILTSTPKNLRQFLNIKFILDIKNSHPLLLSYYLIKEFNISIEIIELINKINKELNNNKALSYDNKNLRKALKNNAIQKQQKAKIPIDVLIYIANVFSGNFWDILLKNETKNPFLLRADIKVTLFREVFYSNSRTTRNKPYAKEFKGQYPNIYKLINKYKPKGNEGQFSNDLMALESEIFQKILTKLYKKRDCCVLSIHDAIVVLNTKGNQKYSANEIEAVMQAVFNDYNLYPTISVESFELDSWKEELNKIEQNKPIIQEVLNQIRAQALDNNDSNQKNATNLLNWIEQGKVEIIIHEGKVMLHNLIPIFELI